mmetsp:Transcript_12270/g.28896  ORF Transcript_12270/g.28896 Transcript_12270/m.28896 type:complete len:218 (+) Transcript_12270:713-1366(+)
MPIFVALLLLSFSDVPVLVGLRRTSLGPPALDGGRSKPPDAVFSPPLGGGVGAGVPTGVDSLPLAPVICDASFADGCNTPAVPPPALARAASSLARASSCAPRATAASALSRSELAPAASSAFTPVPSPRFTAAASTSFSSSARYALAALWLYFLFDPFMSLQPCFEKNLRAFSLPPIFMASIWRWVHSSRSTARTNVRCTPMFRWAALQSRHRNMP